MRRLFAVLALAALVAACSDQTTAPVQEAPVFNTANAPEWSGIVYRFDGRVGVTWADPSGLRLFIGIDVQKRCAGEFDADYSSLQYHFPPNGNYLMLLMQGTDLRATVWEGLPDFNWNDPASCELIQAAAPIATGVADLVRTDNWLAGAPQNNRNNAFGFMAHGVLTRTDNGEVVHLTAHIRFVWPDVPEPVVKSMDVSLR